MASVEEMTVFCKKKGFVFLNSDIYGGYSGFWDFGPLGVELKNNVKKELWKRFVHERDDVVGIDGSIVSHPKVWIASGHVSSFTDYLLDCRKCKARFRADLLLEEEAKVATEGIRLEEIEGLLQKYGIKCPQCQGELSTPRKFNLMFKTHVGPVEDDSSVSYLRPETAQLIFSNFRIVAETSRMKLPFGIAQTGKAFRNEISPRDFLFRSREFEQFELEFFVNPDKKKTCPHFREVEEMEAHFLLSGEKESRKAGFGSLVREGRFATEWHAYWLAVFYRFFLDLGIKAKNLRLREHHREELAHYASACFDIEYNFPFGWKEIHGNADRGTFDLEQHMKLSGKELSLFDEESKKKIVPYVAAEPSQGIERAMLAFLFDAYDDNKERGNIVLRLHPRIAPVKVGIFPLLSNKEEITSLAKKVHAMLKKDFVCQYDQSGSVGRRYARADEMGIPFCITVDFDSLKDKAVTIRNRDDTMQERVKIDELKEKLALLLS
jgi:glycyl-tRNA synthetase